MKFRSYLIQTSRSKIKKNRKAKRLAKSSNLNFTLRQKLKELEKEKEWMKAIIASIPEGLIVVDKKNKILLVNPAAERLLGIKSIEALGKNIKEIITVLKGEEVVSKQEHPVAKALETGKPVILTVKDNVYYQTYSVKKFPVALTIAPLKNRGIVGALVLFRDVTEEKRLDEARTDFVAFSSHQLRAPLNTIRWLSELLLQGEAGELEDKQKSYIDNIYRSATRMARLIDFLLQITRAETGKLKIEPVPIDLKNITQEVIALFKNILDQKSQKIEVKTDPINIIPLVRMDREMIWAVLQNLISNALNYSPAKSKVSISIVLKDKFIQYSIKDNGIGIPEDQKSRIFEKFFRASNAIKVVPEGLGLGLFLVKSLVESWGGKIWFKSKENKGTTFYFTIPLKKIKFKRKK